jgi:tRNA threonylcarbamoyl adenosine modification protein YeaZ
MKTLVLDTSTPYLVMGILDQDQCLASSVRRLERQHAEQLLPTLEALLKQTQSALEDIQEIIFSHGPGSFTGIRLALTMVKTLGLTQTIDVYAIPSLYFLALPNHKVVATMDARGHRYYVAMMDGYHMIQAPHILDEATLEAWLIEHPEWKKRSLETAFHEPKTLFEAAYHAKQHFPKVTSLGTLVPMYLKDIQ